MPGSDFPRGRKGGLWSKPRLGRSLTLSWHSFPPTSLPCFHLLKSLTQAIKHFEWRKHSALVFLELTIHTVFPATLLLTWEGTFCALELNKISITLQLCYLFITQTNSKRIWSYTADIILSHWLLSIVIVNVRKKELILTILSLSPGKGKGYLKLMTRVR